MGVRVPPNTPLATLVAPRRGSAARRNPDRPGNRWPNWRCPGRSFVYSFSDQVSDVAKELKKIGKAERGSSIVPDRRSDGSLVVPARKEGEEA